jgi:hypothetical protein
MAVTYTSLLGLAKPVTGTEAGTWGDVVNDYLTTYLDAAVAGAQTISGTQTAVTLTVANGTALVQAAATSAGSSQYQIINCTGNPASTLVITAPASSKVYLVINATSTNQSVTVRGAGSPPTTGITIPALTRSLVAWNGADYILIASNRITDLTGTLATGNGGTGLTTFTAANNAIYSTSSSALTAGTLPVAAGGTGATTLTGVVKASGTSAFTASNVSLSSEVTGTLPVGNGGTGATTLTANNVLLGNGTSAVQVVAPSTSGNVLTSNGTTWVSSAASPSPNKIINGDMEIAQRNTSFTSVTNGTYTLDRWFYGASGTTGVLDITRNAVDYPSNQGFLYSLRATVTTADASVAASDVSRICQSLEGINITDLIGKTFTMSFWVRSAKTGTHCVSFTGTSAAASVNSYVAEYTISAANTWEQKTITVTDGLQSSFSWRSDIGIAGMTVNFTLMCGSSSQATVNTWTSGSPPKFVTSSGAATNLLDTNGNIFAITGVQLSLGSAASAFEFLSFGENLAQCQRYYSKSYNYDVNPGTVTSAGQIRATVAYPNAYATFPVTFPVERCATPTITVYSPATGGTGVVRDVGSGTNVAVSGTEFGTRGGNIYVSGGLQNGDYALAHFAASSEI